MPDDNRRKPSKSGKGTPTKPVPGKGGANVASSPRPNPATSSSSTTRQPSDSSNMAGPSSRATAFDRPMLRDKLLNGRVWAANDDDDLAKRFVEELVQMPALEGITKYCNKHLGMLPTDLKLNPLGTLEMIQPFLECDIRLAYSRWMQYNVDREGWMVDRRAQLEVVYRMIAYLRERGDTSGFTDTTRRGLAASVELEYAAVNSPRNAAKNVTRVQVSGDGAETLSRDVRPVCNSRPGSAPIIASFVPVPGLPATQARPVDLCMAEEPFAEALCGFMQHTAHNILYQRQPRDTCSGLLLAGDEKTNFFATKKLRRGFNQFFPSYFLDRKPENQKVEYTGDLTNHCLQFPPMPRFPIPPSDTGAVSSESDDDANDGAADADDAGGADVTDGLHNTCISSRRRVPSR